jgi:DNA-binding Xre family transcriptional regulator
LISRRCEAFVKSRSSVKPHVRYNFVITRFVPQAHGRKFLPRDDNSNYTPRHADATINAVLGFREGRIGQIRLQVKEVAEARGYSISTLAAAANLNYQTVHKLWHNQTKRLDTETLQKLAAALQAKALDLLTEDE